ncbi:hypothetical protein JM47_00410 [Ureaplasma diversum]|uniref:Uncharacterized protein n=2 Tax=Ureaplasma diversum TaxID=42094 RepID=A0A084EZ01_9BACT|nr:hypothetical protein [Ureaplasma diversum]AJQ45124.1 hypothetical protein JM47_00410 [Ureaplasma diversum]KEZ23193.1 Hypothetical protein, predicted transmembrane protein [Ureaplasma diversum NCTC 246]
MDRSKRTKKIIFWTLGSILIAIVLATSIVGIAFLASLHRTTISRQVVLADNHKTELKLNKQYKKNAVDRYKADSLPYQFYLKHNQIDQANKLVNDFETKWLNHFDDFESTYSSKYIDYITNYLNQELRLEFSSNQEFNKFYKQLLKEEFIKKYQSYQGFSEQELDKILNQTRDELIKQKLRVYELTLIQQNPNKK